MVSDGILKDIREWMKLYQVSESAKMEGLIGYLKDLLRS